LDPTGAGDRTKLISPYQSHQKLKSASLLNNQISCNQSSMAAVVLRIRKDIECLNKSEIHVCCTFGDGSTCMGWEGKMLSVSASMNKTRNKAKAW